MTTFNKRVMKELNELKTNTDYIETCAIRLINNNMNDMRAILFGPPDSAFADGIYELKIIIPSGYPFSPPQISFLTKIFHPNVSNKDEGNKHNYIYIYL